jgi:pimeloyl-ACP methyl ester carboxylesterase
MITEKGVKPEKIIFCDAAVVREERLNLRQRISKILAMTGVKFISKDSRAYSFFEKITYKISGTYDYYRANPIMKEVFKKVVKEDLSHLLPEVKMPCLIIWGSDDQITPVEDGVLFQQEIDDSELKIIKGGRHNPYKTHAEEVSAAIIKFLNK